MTYSYSVPVDPFDEHWDAIGAAIDALPDPGQAEARAHRSAVGVAVVELAQLVPPASDKARNARKLTVSGHGDEASASFSVTVYRPAVATGQG